MTSLKRSEHKEQVEVVNWLRAHGVLFCAIPNAAKRSPQTAAYLKAEGMSAGAPDVVIFDRPTRGIAGIAGVAIEMKAARGGRLSLEQKSWHAALRARDWVVIIGHGASDAIMQLEELGYGK